MNSGLINGPVQAQKNGRWRRWESTMPGTPYDPATGLATTTAVNDISAIVPVPSFVSVVRVSAVAGSVGNAAGSAGSGAACKNVLLAIDCGKELHVVQLYDGSVRIGVLTPAGQLSTDSLSDIYYDLRIKLAPGTGNPQSGGNVTVTRALGPNAFNSVTIATVSTMMPLLGGTLVAGFNSAAAVSPLNSQIRYAGATGAPSHLLAGPHTTTYKTVPGASYFGSFADMIQPSYVLVEWME